MQLAPCAANHNLYRTVVLLFQLPVSEHIAYMAKMYDSVQRACHEYEKWMKAMFISC